MNIRNITKVLVILVFVFMISCEKLLIKTDPKDTPINNFELLWQEANNRYTFFEYKNIDWDASYKKYRPQISDGMSDQQLFNVLAQMMNDLKDGHTNLVSDFDISRSYGWYLDYPPNFNKNIIERNYLGSDYQRTGPFSNTFLSQNVGYIRYSSFMDIGDSTNLNYLMDKYKNTKGLIIDVRDNTGGAVAMVNTIVAHFIDKDQTLAYERYKKSAAKNDFTDYDPFFVKKATKTYSGKVAVLSNRLVFSAANIFVSAMSELPNVTIIGDQSGGGGGAPISGELLNGWTYRFSGNQFVNLRKEQIESGIVPDIKLDITPQDEANGKDTILEYAIKLLDK